MKIKDEIFEALKEITPEKIAKEIAGDNLSKYCALVKKRILSIVENVETENTINDKFGEFQMYTKWGFRTNKGMIPLHVCGLLETEYEGIEIELKSDSSDDEYKYFSMRHNLEWCKKNLTKL